MELIEATVRAYILSEFLDEKESHTLSSSTPLLSGGVIDSVGIYRLISYIETRFAIQLPDNDIVVDNLDTIGSIVKLIERNLPNTQKLNDPQA